MRVEEASQAGVVRYANRISQIVKMNSIVCVFIFRTILKATVILLPLLGITWVFGILAVNQESSVFAWIFTILNSLQVSFYDKIYLYCANIWQCKMLVKL